MVWPSVIRDGCYKSGTVPEIPGQLEPMEHDKYSGMVSSSLLILIDYSYRCVYLIVFSNYLLSHSVRCASVHLTHTNQMYAHLCTLWLSQLLSVVSRVGVKKFLCGHSCEPVSKNPYEESDVYIRAGIHTTVNVYTRI